MEGMRLFFLDGRKALLRTYYTNIQCVTLVKQAWVSKSQYFWVLFTLFPLHQISQTVRHRKLAQNGGMIKYIHQTLMHSNMLAYFVKNILDECIYNQQSKLSKRVVPDSRNHYHITIIITITGGKMNECARPVNFTHSWHGNHQKLGLNIYGHCDDVREGGGTYGFCKCRWFSYIFSL